MKPLTFAHAAAGWTIIALASPCAVAAGNGQRESGTPPDVDHGRPRLSSSDNSSIRPLPEGAGLAAKYRGDAGLASDRAVLFAENFEDGEIADVQKRWNETSNERGEVLALSDDHPPTSAGTHSLQMTSNLARNTGGHLYKKLGRDAETVFARFYVKFANDAEYVHHFVQLGGYYPATTWPQGGAGERPRGDERFTVGIEPTGDHGRLPPPGMWNFYAYWSEMKKSADGKYWGNAIAPVAPAIVARNRWQCVEVMLKCNATPAKRDGELALWLEGRLTMHLAPGTSRGPWTGMGFQPLAPDAGGEPFEGFLWRKTPELKVNFFWLLFYVTEGAARQNKARTPQPLNRVWFDDIVVATEYVGPIVPAR
jgi:hypothetical protein